MAKRRWSHGLNSTYEYPLCIRQKPSDYIFRRFKISPVFSSSSVLGTRTLPSAGGAIIGSRCAWRRMENPENSWWRECCQFFLLRMIFRRLVAMWEHSFRRQCAWVIFSWQISLTRNIIGTNSRLQHSPGVQCFTIVACFRVTHYKIVWKWIQFTLISLLLDSKRLIK